MFLYITFLIDTVIIANAAELHQAIGIAVMIHSVYTVYLILKEIDKDYDTKIFSSKK